MSSITTQLKNPALFQRRAYSHGQWIDARSKAEFDVDDPGTGGVIASCPDLAVEDVDAILQSSHQAFQEYKAINPRKRAELLLRWHQLIRDHRDDIALILSRETGKPLAEAYGEIDYATGFTWWWFAGEAERIRGDISTPSAPNRRVVILKQPIGVCVALVPWNFPVAMILRKVGAALAAGCTMIAKPSPETPLTTLTLAKLATEAGFAPGVFNVITTSNANTPAVSEALCTHSLVQKVSFTGSTAVGSIIARHCAIGIKRLTLELGGNCPMVIFSDANQEQALAQLTALKWRHAGQACITANRIYVQDEIYEEFLAKLVDHAKSIKVGHGLDDRTTMGPLTTRWGVEKARRLVDDAVADGANIVHGGKELEGGCFGGGYFFEPTILRDVTAKAQVTQEECFAPIAAVYRFKTEEEVLRLANDTNMGLASYVFTKDVDRSWRMLEGLDAGMIGLNTGNSSAAESPFGGMKMSGYGKESGKEVAVAEYLVSKTCTMTVEGARV
ncbi:succinate semialdehyde dehydrogenase [Aspergillus sclerotiicarbonarius CBS 121057]|uniref:succinate-semialdehyde dehydrogenase [NAD(P)(+)] n=1 Tax=Aspergillus sclerotiicarbonarius (strain CBS 121057 / IBT 28362) TaxID=1448318 RepID=A0A319DZ86_ASPSB|nr:succinate semialdehyde dehydrogenase [Aspergillus sclerotiicarbonarius CBS 121057]